MSTLCCRMRVKIRVSRLWPWLRRLLMRGIRFMMSSSFWKFLIGSRSANVRSYRRLREISFRGRSIALVAILRSWRRILPRAPLKHARITSTFNNSWKTWKPISPQSNKSSHPTAAVNGFNSNQSKQPASSIWPTHCTRTTWKLPAGTTGR